MRVLKHCTKVSPVFAQRSCGCPISESVQGHIGCGQVEQPGLMGGTPACGRGLAILFLLKVTLYKSNKKCWVTSFLNTEEKKLPHGVLNIVNQFFLIFTVSCKHLGFDTSILMQ